MVDQRGVFGSSLELRDANKTVTYSGSPEEIEAECEALDALDKETEMRRTAAAVAAFATGVLCMIGFVTDSFWMVGICFALAVAALVYRASIGSDDIEDRKLATARELLSALAPELKRGRPVKLDLDFRLYDNDRTDGVWMTLATTLEDGTGLALDVSTHFKRKTRAKRKYTKIKDKIHERLTLTFTPPKGRRFVPGAKARIAPTRLPALALRAVKVSPKATTLTFSSPQMLRVRGRGGWNNGGLTHLIDEKAALFAIIASYRALAESGVSQAS